MRIVVKRVLKKTKYIPYPSIKLSEAQLESNKDAHACFLVQCLYRLQKKSDFNLRMLFVLEFKLYSTVSEREVELLFKLKI